MTLECPDEPDPAEEEEKRELVEQQKEQLRKPPQMHNRVGDAIAVTLANFDDHVPCC